jgi:hypothetical protein
MSRIVIVGCFLVCVVAGAVATPSSPGARTAGPPCGLRLSAPRFGEPRFAVPAGGSVRRRLLAGGGFACTLLRAGGSRFARAVRDGYGNVLEMDFYRASGQLLVTQDRAVAALTGSPAPPDVSCGSNSQATIGPKFWTKSMVWYVGNAPPGVDQKKAVDALRNAMSEWLNNINWCGIKDKAHPPVRYEGTTSKPGMKDDNANVMDFGSLGDDQGCEGAVACAQTWYDGSGKPIESDVRFNTQYKWVVGAKSGAFDIQSIAAHEFGHLLQFDHVSNVSKNDDSVVMWPYVTYANTTARKLGKGDANADNAHYDT